jgi:two-component system cell cycle sensor histidine kinase/response regulator CckA
LFDWCYYSTVPSFERCVVLIADDEPMILQLTSRALRRQGYDVIVAADGPAALRASQERQGPIHLAVLDVMMPGMTGPELFVRLQPVHPETAVLFMSGYRPEQVAPMVARSHFIAKPFLPRALVQRVNEILGNTDVCVLIEEEPETARQSCTP